MSLVFHGSIQFIIYRGWHLKSSVRSCRGVRPVAQMKKTTRYRLYVLVISLPDLKILSSATEKAYWSSTISNSASTDVFGVSRFAGWIQGVAEENDISVFAQTCSRHSCLQSVSSVVLFQDFTENTIWCFTCAQPSCSPEAQWSVIAASILHLATWFGILSSEEDWEKELGICGILSNEWVRKEFWSDG